MDNYLYDLFINEAKAALKKYAGPVKLSDLENDLFYVKRKPYISWTKDDLTINSVFGDEVPVVVADCDPSMLSVTNKFGYSFEKTVDGATVVITEETSPLFGGLIEGTDDVPEHYEYYDERNLISIIAGIDADTFLPADKVYIFILDPTVFNYDDLNITLFTIASKKIPIELCDTAEVEDAIVTEINALKDEVSGI